MTYGPFVQIKHCHLTFSYISNTILRMNASDEIFIRLNGDFQEVGRMKAISAIHKINILAMSLTSPLFISE